MRRKPLSMKSLHQYAIDYLLDIEKQEKNNFSGKEIIEITEYESETIKQFIEYIWKNPK